MGDYGGGYGPPHGGGYNADGYRGSYGSGYNSGYGKGGYEGYGGKGGKGQSDRYQAYGGEWGGGKGWDAGYGGKGGKGLGNRFSLSDEDRDVQSGDTRYEWTDSSRFNPFDWVKHPLFGVYSKAHTQGEEGANVHIRNLPRHADRLYLYSLFAPFGALNSIRCQQDEHTGRCEGWGLVKYHYTNDAQNAINTLSGFKIDGRTLIVELSKPSPRQGGAPRPQGETAAPVEAADAGAGAQPMY